MEERIASIDEVIEWVRGHANFFPSREAAERAVQRAILEWECGDDFLTTDDEVRSVYMDGLLTEYMFHELCLIHGHELTGKPGKHHLVASTFSILRSIGDFLAFNRQGMKGGRDG